MEVQADQTASEPWQTCAGCPDTILQLVHQNENAYMEWVRCEDDCQEWYHYECEGLSKESIKHYGPLDPYICRRCMGADLSRSVTHLVDEEGSDGHFTATSGIREPSLWSSVLADLPSVTQESASKTFLFQWEIKKHKKRRGEVRSAVKKERKIRARQPCQWQLKQEFAEEIKPDFPSRARDERPRACKTSQRDAFMGDENSTVFRNDGPSVAERLRYKAVFPAAHFGGSTSFAHENSFQPSTDHSLGIQQNLPETTVKRGRGRPRKVKVSNNVDVSDARCTDTTNSSSGRLKSRIKLEHPRIISIASLASPHVFIPVKSSPKVSPRGWEERPKVMANNDYSEGVHVPTAKYVVIEFDSSNSDESPENEASSIPVIVNDKFLDQDWVAELIRRVEKLDPTCTRESMASALQDCKMQREVWTIVKRIRGVSGRSHHSE